MAAADDLALSSLKQLTDILRDGGPWTLLAIMIILYVNKDRENRRLYSRIIDMSTVQAGLTAKIELTVGALQRTLADALEKWRE